MPTQSMRRAQAASRKNTLGPIRKNTGPVWPKSFHAPPRRPYPPGPIVDPAVLVEMRRDHRVIQRNLLLLKRDLAWDDVINKAIRLCRLVRDAELAELDAKYRPDQPRVPAGNPDGGQWVDEGGGGGRAGVAGTAPADASIKIDEAARVAAQAAAKLRQVLQAGGQIVTAAGVGTRWAGDPRNIMFVRGQAGNLARHGGRFQNPTTGRLIDRKAMIAKGTKGPR